jgi:nucleotide-binding universal stress UspA family protein
MEDTYKNILVAVDGSDQAEAAYQEAIKIAKRNGASLHILYVIEEMANYFGELTFSMGQMMEEIQEKEEEEMKRRKANAHAAGINNVFTYVIYGYPKSLIADFSQSEEPIDLIVLGKTGLNGFQRMMVGSTTAYVVNHTKANVLVVNGSV